MIQDSLERLKVQNRVDIEREDIANRHHYIFDTLALEIKRSRDELELLVLDADARVLGLTDKLANLVARIRDGRLFAQEEVEDLSERVGERERDNHHAIGDVARERADGEAVSRADRLRDYLAEYDDEQRRADRCEYALEVAA